MGTLVSLLDVRRSTGRFLRFSIAAVLALAVFVALTLLLGHPMPWVILSAASLPVLVVVFVVMPMHRGRGR